MTHGAMTSDKPVHDDAEQGPGAGGREADRPVGPQFPYRSISPGFLK